RRNNQERDLLSKTLCDGDSLSEEHLFVLAEALIFGAQVLWPARAHHANAHDDYVAIFGLCSAEHPFERDRVCSVAHGHHHAAWPQGHRFAIDIVLMLELEVILHLPSCEGMLSQVRAFRDCEEHEE